jgi:HK97 family phage major capsid protein
MSSSALAATRKIKDHHWMQYSESTFYLLGYKVIVCEDMPLITNDLKGCFAVFGNFKRGYFIVDRKGLSILRDPYSAKPYIEFYATARVGGDVIDPKAFSFMTINS